MAKYTFTPNKISQKMTNTSYINEHIANVIKSFNIAGQYFQYIFDDVFSNVKLMKDLKYEIENHDKSKFSKEEFDYYAQKFFPVTCIDDPESDLIKNNFNKAWLHHINNNPHHPEYWVMWDNGEIKIMDMDDIQIICMLCDWMAMTIKFGGSTKKWYYEIGKNKLPLSEYTKNKVESFLDIIPSNL